MFVMVEVLMIDCVFESKYCVFGSKQVGHLGMGDVVGGEAEWQLED